MTNAISNYLGNAFLNAYLASKSTYLALHTDDPTVTGDASTELAGDGYLRQPLVWTAPGSKTTANSNKLTFVQLPAASIPFLAIWDQQADGHMLFSIDLVASGLAVLHVLASGQVLVAPGDVSVIL